MVGTVEPEKERKGKKIFFYERFSPALPGKNNQMVLSIKPLMN